METPKSEFQIWTRLIFNLLRGHHHLRQMRRGTRTNEVPPSFRGIKNFLAHVASPALPTASTATLLRGNASNWLQVNLQILEEHYENMIAGVKTNLLRPVDIDHQEAWLVALRWAFSKYRIDEEVMTSVMNDLVGVGLRIDQIPGGTSLRALMDVPTRRPRPKTRQKPKGATTSRSPLPSTNCDTQFDPDDQSSACTPMDPHDLPLTTTPIDQDPPPTDDKPPPKPETYVTTRLSRKKTPSDTTSKVHCETPTYCRPRTRNEYKTQHPPPGHRHWSRPPDEPDGPTPHHRGHGTTPTNYLPRTRCDCRAQVPSPGH